MADYILYGMRGKDMKYCIQCRDVVSGKIGTFCYDLSHLK